MNDPIVEEVRRIRDELARKFNYDLHAMCEEMRRQQKLHGDKVVSFPKRPVRCNPINQEPESSTEAEPRHPSDSREQREAEIAVRRDVEVALGCTLAEETVPVGDQAFVKVDGFNRDRRILCEIYSRVGKLKGAQPDKLASDMLKLLLAEQSLGEKWRKLICLVDADAAKCVLGKSWLAEAARRMGFKIKIVEVSPSTRDCIIAAQQRQVMVNPSTAAADTRVE